MMVTSLCFLSCGGDDSEPPLTEAVTYEEGQIRTGCRIFGLNRESYDYFNTIDRDNTSIFACIRKSDNALFIGIYDRDTERIIFKNDQIKVNAEETFQYYDQRYTSGISGIGYDNVVTEKGFVIMINLRYGNSPASMCLPVVYFNNGISTIAKKFELSDMPAYITSWHSNTCIITISDEVRQCYTDEGKLLYTCANNIPNDVWFAAKESANTYFVTNSDFINLIYEANKLVAYRYDLAEGTYLFQNSIEILQGVSSDSRVTISVTTGDSWTIEVKAVAKDGTTKTAIISLNIATGEMTV